MKNKLKDILAPSIFILIIFTFAILGVVLKDKDVSYSERRKYDKFPKITFEDLTDGSFFTDLESYLQDQFPLRDVFRGVKSFTALNIFNMEDVNGLFLNGDEIYYTEYPLNEKNIYSAAEKFNKIYDMYLNDTNRCYFGIIPDKTYYAPEKKLYMDYRKLEDIMCENVKNMQYIDLFSVLGKDDYYLSDAHWKQQNLQNVVDTLAENMDFEGADLTQYTQKDLGPWKGVYHGRISMFTQQDSLIYLTNDIIENATVFNYENNKEEKVYFDRLYSDIDPYSVFLKGPASLMKITNNNADTDKELIIFRDSFGSSLAPLLIESYKSITLVDIRYISASYLENFDIEFENKDVLFLYSTTILNNSVGLRI